MTETKPERFDECLNPVGRWDTNCLTPNEVKNIQFIYAREGYDYYVAEFIQQKYFYRTKKEKVCDKCNGSGKL